MLRLVLKCYLAGEAFSHSICIVMVLQSTQSMQELAKVSLRIRQKRKSTIPISHSCRAECWDCSSDCGISINLETLLDTGASDREGETLSRSITSMACHSYKLPDWFTSRHPVLPFCLIDFGHSVKTWMTEQDDNWQRCHLYCQQSNMDSGLVIVQGQIFITAFKWYE